MTEPIIYCGPFLTLDDRHEVIEGPFVRYEEAQAQLRENEVSRHNILGLENHIADCYGQAAAILQKYWPDVPLTPGLTFVLRDIERELAKSKRGQ